jgi:hypothetical protein
VGPPHKQRYLSYKAQPQQPSAAAGAGGLLAAAKAALFESGAFARLLKAMIDVEILKHAGEVRRFRAGEVCQGVWSGEANCRCRLDDMSAHHQHTC